MSENPFLKKDFYVDWSSLNHKNIVKDISTVVGLAKANVERIAQQNVDTLSYATTLGALEHATFALEQSWSLVMHLNDVSNNDDFRKAFNQMLPIVSDFNSSIFLNNQLWDVIQAFANTEQVKLLNDV